MTTAVQQPPRSARYQSMFRSMASQIRVDSAASSATVAEVQELFRRVEASCTRFVPDSPLMLANAAADGWQAVPPECFAAVSEAAVAHVLTGGRFDPRILTGLVRLGYDRTLPFPRSPLDDAVQVAADRAEPVPLDPGWRPGLDVARQAVRIGVDPVDLGGIGKGLAVRWAAGLLRRGDGGPFLVDAGGDLFAGGDGPDGGGWRIGVEDPRGGRRPVAVLRLSDLACATSSVRVRSWSVQGRAVHHLIDPRTGTSAAGGLRAVTVVGPDAALAEVWSKALLIAGPDAAALAGVEGLAALWVTDQDEVGISDAMAEHVLWTGR